MEQSRRLFEVPVYRKALIYAFKMITPTSDKYTYKYSMDYLRSLLKQQVLFTEFQHALHCLNEHLNEHLVVPPWTEEEWNTEVVDNPLVIDFLRSLKKKDLI